MITKPLLLNRLAAVFAQDLCSLVRVYPKAVSLTQPSLSLWVIRVSNPEPLVKHIKNPWQAGKGQQGGIEDAFKTTIPNQNFDNVEQRRGDLWLL